MWSRRLGGTRLMMDGMVEGVCALRRGEDGVAVITLSQPQKRNALGSDMLEYLSDHVEALAHDAGVRALIIDHAQGSSVFSSGHNLVELSVMERSRQEDMLRSSTRTMLQLAALPFPVICRVDGLAAAAGAQLVAHCDLAYCTQRSTFSTPGIRFGFFCSTPGTALYQRSSHHSKMLMHMLMTGDAISSEEALRIGLVSHVFPDAEKMNVFVASTIERIKSLPCDALALGKSAFHRQSQMKRTSDAMSFATDIMIDNLQLENTKEGLRAFGEKRHPNWK